MSQKEKPSLKVVEKEPITDVINLTDPERVSINNLAIEALEVALENAKAGKLDAVFLTTIYSKQAEEFVEDDGNSSYTYQYNSYHRLVGVVTCHLNRLLKKSQDEY